ncbi:MAG: ArsR family transcriptional regulator [Thermoplasmatota archaeon]
MAARVRADPVLDLAMRRRLYAAVREYPGIHVRAVARHLDTSLALVEYHLDRLRAHGLVTVDKNDRYVRLYAQDAAAPGQEDRPALAVLRERLPLQVTLCLLDKGPTRHKDLADELAIGKSKLSFHLRKLEAAGVVARDADGLFGVADIARVQRLLLEFPPTSDLREEFADVWLALYGER